MRLAIILAAICATTSMPTTTKRSEGVDSSDDDGEEWVCGTDALSKNIAESQIDLDCPHLKKVVNQCCQVHDKCYVDQLGRKYCDDTFCQCLDSVTKGSEVCNSEVGPLFCSAVQRYGAFSYCQVGNCTGVDGIFGDAQESSNGTFTALSETADKGNEAKLRKEAALGGTIKNLDDFFKLYN